MNELLLNERSAQFFFWLSDVIGYAYLCLKVYRVMCLTRLTLDQLPMFNPYIFPINFIRLYTNTYFVFWKKILPPLRFGSYPFDMSGLIALQFISQILPLIVHIRYFCLVQAVNISSILNLPIQY